MRTKMLLVAGAVAVLGSVASYAQVYSQNTVGFYTVNLVQGFNLIANQFNNGDNGVNTLMPPTTDLPADTTIQLWDVDLQTFTSPDTFFPGNGWFDANELPSTKVLNPGDGAFIQMPGGTSRALVLVGDVPEGNLSRELKVGFQMVSQLTPQKLGFNASGFPGADGDAIQFWDSAVQDYPFGRFLFYYSSIPGWADAGEIVTDPTPEIGEAVFYQRAVGAGTTQWTRTFDVSPGP